MSTINYLQGYAFAKKKGDRIDVFEGPHTLADFMPVIAEGTDVPRMLKDRFADVVNVKDFGAKGDGVTDDTEAIQAACDHAGALGFALIVFPHGSYKVTERIALPGNCSVNGFGSRILCSSSNGAFMVEGQGLGTQVALGSNATSGDTTITTASAHGLVAGDMALLWSQRDSLSEAAGDWRLGYHQGLKCYFAEPVSIQAVPSTTTVSLSNGCGAGYRERSYRCDARKTELLGERHDPKLCYRPRRFRLRNFGAVRKEFRRR